MRCAAGNVPRARRASVALSPAARPARPGIYSSAQYDPNDERWKHVADATCAGWSCLDGSCDTNTTGVESCLNATHRCEPVDASTIGTPQGTCTPNGSSGACWEHTDPLIFGISVLFGLSSLVDGIKGVCQGKGVGPD